MLFRSPDISLDASSKIEYDAASTVTATNAINLSQWNIVGVTLSGTTVAHYLNGTANGSGTSASGNTFAALRIGYDGTAYWDGGFALLAVYSRAMTAAQVASATQQIAGAQCSALGRLCDVASETYPAYGWLLPPGSTWLLADIHPLTWADETVKETFDVMAETRRDYR